MIQNKTIDNIYKPKFFNDSSINTILRTKETQIMVLFRDSDNKSLYDNFDEQFSVYLTKLSSNKLKTYITNLFNKQMIFIGNSSGPKNEAVFARVLLNPSGDGINGIVLDASVLDIDVVTGDVLSIDDCLYASYFGIIRSAILINSSQISSDFDLHALVIQYIYLLMLRAVGQKSTYNKKQKMYVYLACAYTYYAHFLLIKHNTILSYLKKKHSDFVDRDTLNEFIELLLSIQKYTSIKDIPKMLNDINVYNDNPTKIYFELLKILGNSGFYCLISSLDQLIPMIILSKYPTNLYDKKAITSQKIHDTIEELIYNYIDKLKFVRTDILYGKK